MVTEPEAISMFSDPSDPTQYSIDNLPPFMDHWKNAVENGVTPEQIAAERYDDNADLKGTIAEDFVQGYDKIRDYFILFTKGKSNVRIEFETIEFDPEDGMYKGDYTFHWTDDDQQSHSLPATYKFKPTDVSPKTAQIAHHYSHPRAEL